MIAWLIAFTAGFGFAALQYARVFAAQHLSAVPLAVLRAAAVTLLVALLLDAPAGRVTSAPALVALDASLSWQRGDTSRWSQALTAAGTAAGDSLFLVGDSLRLASGPVGARDTESSVAPIVEQARAQGRPLLLFTDGELPAADVVAIEDLPRGSRLEVLPARPAIDAAVAVLAAPRSVVGGDTLRANVTVISGPAAVPATTLTLRLDDVTLATLPVPRLAPHSVRELSTTVSITAREGPHVLLAALPGADVEPRNDTLGVAIDVSASSAAVWISSAPDLDGRAALLVLRGSLAVPTRGFLRVAPGTWREEGTLAPVSEAVVRQAAADASMLVIHGDTAVFGPPRALAGTAPLALLPGPGPGRSAPDAQPAALDEWYASGAPMSPAVSALAGVPWDSLPPVSLAASAGLTPPSGARAWMAVEGRRARRGDPLPFVVGTESPRRVVVSRATGMWRWLARGGAGAVAYQALWGSLFDWMSDGRRDRRAAVPERRSVREGEPLTWRIASTPDSGTRVALTRRGDPGGGRTLTLRPSAGTIFAESPALPAGVYDVESLGGRSILVVNAARELLPAAPTVRGGAHGDGVVAGSAPALRNLGVAYAAIVLLLCAEWAFRRGHGLA